MKYLVLGATGMAGHTISIYLKEQGYDVTAFTTTPFPYCKNVVGDATDKPFITSILTDYDYDVVINCIGILNDVCDKNPSLAIYLNSYLPHFIAEVLKDTKKKLIHTSTDCVFSGKSGAYSENSFRDGETLYDRTKALGEVDDEKNLTFRNSIIGPDMKENGIGLFNWFMKQSGTIYGYNKAIWTGVTTLSLARAMEKAALENLTGVFNLVNNAKISKYELLSLFNKHMKENSLVISPSSILKVDKSLVSNRNDFSFIVPEYEQMIVEMKEWIYSHKNLYPHYFT